MRIDKYLSGLDIKIVETGNPEYDLTLLELKSLRIKFDKIFEEFSLESQKSLKNPIIRKAITNQASKKNMFEGLSSKEIEELAKLGKENDYIKSINIRNEKLFKLFDKNALEKTVNYMLDKKINSFLKGRKIPNDDFLELKKDLKPSVKEDIADETFIELINTYKKPRESGK